MLIAGNWKMNTDVKEGRALASRIAEGIAENEGYDAIDLAVCPPFVHLPGVGEALSHVPVALGAQNMHAGEEGSYTGEVSAPMLTSVGCSHVILGHSERRQYFDETDTDINKKVSQARAHDLVPILCVGESIEQRRSGNADAVVRSQLRGGLEGVSITSGNDLVVAYEPIWAIGTGESATPEQAQDMHALIRDELSNRYGGDVAVDVPLLYGGSMKPHNATGLLSQSDVDGGLIGSASLAADSFLGIADCAMEVVGAEG